MNLPEHDCPETGFKKSCRDVLATHKCPKFITIIGTDPNTGQEVNRCGCAEGFIPMLLIENSQQQRQTAAAVESFRNEMVRANERSAEVLMATLALTSPASPDNSRGLPPVDRCAGPIEPRSPGVQR